MSEPMPPPLAHLGGLPPPAPAWFHEALATPPELARILVEGAGIELLVWGQAGAPGILLMHGGYAHARWWLHIAPFLAERHRVAAFSWSGMGGSDWRERYSVDIWVAEAMAAAEAAGLFDAGPPVFVGHSLGAAPTLLAAHRHGDRLAAAILLDSGVSPPTHATNRPPRIPTHRPYPTPSAAIARFRFLPEQPTANLFIADLIARHSIRPIQNGHVAWSFDPALFSRLARWDSWSALAAPRCPIAVVHGTLSRVATPELVDLQQAEAPPHTRFVALPESHHHLMVDKPLELITTLKVLIRQLARPGPHSAAA